MILKTNEWLGYSKDITDTVARAYGSLRLGCKPEDVEVKHTGGATLIRVRQNRKGENNEAGQDGQMDNLAGCGDSAAANDA